MWVVAFGQRVLAPARRLPPSSMPPCSTSPALWVWQRWCSVAVVRPCLRHAVQQAAVHSFLIGGVLGAVALKGFVRLALQVVLQRLQRRLQAAQGGGREGGVHEHIGGDCRQRKGDASMGHHSVRCVSLQACLRVHRGVYFAGRAAGVRRWRSARCATPAAPAAPAAPTCR